MESALRQATMGVCATDLSVRDSVQAHNFLEVAQPHKFWNRTRALQDLVKPVTLFKFGYVVVLVMKTIALPKEISYASGKGAELRRCGSECASSKNTYQNYVVRKLALTMRTRRAQSRACWGCLS